MSRSDPTAFSAAEAPTVTAPVSVPPVPPVSVPGAPVTAPPASHERQKAPVTITTKEDAEAATTDLTDLDPLRDHDLDLAFHELGLDPLILPGEARPFCSHVWKISSLPQKPSTYPGLAMNLESGGPASGDMHDHLVLRSERDLYRKLLELGTSSELEPFLREALELVTRVCGARCGYLELRHEGSPGTEIAASSGLGLSSEDLDAVRTMISRGVIAEAMASGRTVETASALDDPRFERRESVKANRIEAVLCVPVGSDPPLGVLYLQDRLAGGRFATEDRAHAELVARHIAPYGERLLLRKQVAEVRDFTSTYRASLDLTKIAGRSEAMGRLLREVSLVASRNITVLLTGPSGCGKTQLARSIHANGPRPNGPFVELNCATLPENLVESELFGSMPGAHSTATRRIPGKVEAAEGGTLFLDEIGELPLGAQAKLLQLLQSFEYFPLGSTKAIKVDLRVIAATNTDLRAAVARKAFREDLLYRLEVVPIRVPPLAARRDDIRELMEIFCRRASETHKLGDLQLSPGVVRAAEVADWPGNVRQLENAVEAACIRAAGRESLRVELEDMFPDDIKDNKTMSDSKSGTTTSEGASSNAAPQQETFQAATRRFHAQLLLRTLEETDWNVVETARRLDVTRSHVYNLIRAHGIERAPRSK